ncbi:MAG: electron transport complex subunit RsxE [bacterium]|nr:electron transport complex subunit RsxE [bacterium]
MMIARRINVWKHFSDGVTTNNPVLVLMLGLCSVIAVSTNALSALGMGIAFTFVMVCSNVLISVVRNVTPDTIRIPVFIIIISTFVTITDYVLQAFMPVIHSQLGIFLPLIAINCIVFGRAESFASKNKPVASLFDGLGIGIGFTIVIFLMGAIREILGNGTICGKMVLGKAFAASPIAFMILPPGGFLVIAFLIGMKNWLSNKGEK